MKKFPLILIVLALVTGACAAPAAPAAEGNAPAADSLTVTDGTTTVVYTTADLQALESSQATFREVAYQGVPLAVLLRAAGFDPEDLAAVKATAVDGFSANYEPALVNRPDMLVAYARVDGPLAEDEKPFRIVLPDAEGAQNPRQLSEIRVIR